MLVEAKHSGLSKGINKLDEDSWPGQYASVLHKLNMTQIYLLRDFFFT